MSGFGVVVGVIAQRFALALGLVMLPVAAFGAPTPGPAPTASAQQVHDGGTIVGKIVTIDYQRNVLGVDTAARGHIDVSVMPSTSIQGNDSAYHAFTDLKTGQRVQILSSIADGKYVAQIIRIR